MADDDGFLSRWARRKAGVKAGVAAPEAPVEAVREPASGPSSLPAAVSPASPAAGAEIAPAAAPAAAEPAPLPTLADVAKLTHASDFSPYVDANVDAGVRNAAMKKLFSDPRFNIMDGLDTYIDDYGKPDPIPLSVLRQMNQSAVLGLFSDEAAPAMPQAEVPAPTAEACPDGGDPGVVAESQLPDSPLPAPEPRAHDDPDLQLQPDDADRRPGAGPGPRG